VSSVVVFGYRNEATILRAVRSVMDKDSDDPFEMIVATSGGDGSAELIHHSYPGMRWPRTREGVEKPLRVTNFFLPPRYAGE
jgi:hypothetical protein